MILEIGCGTGSLTSLMADRGAVVIAVDVDPAMAMLTAEAVSGLPHVRVLNRDALAGKNRLDPEVVDSVRSALADRTRKQFKLVANLPYHVATPLIINLLVHDKLCPDLMVVTIQRELAERFCATAATRAYGAVSVLIQALADVSIVRLLPPSVFWPRPQVDSAVVTIRPSRSKRDFLGDVPWFHEVVAALFLQRRKCLRHVLAMTWCSGLSNAEVDRWLETYGINGELRAESLGVDQFLLLARALREHHGNPARELLNKPDESDTNIEPDDDRN